MTETAIYDLAFSEIAFENKTKEIAKKHNIDFIECLTHSIKSMLATHNLTLKDVFTPDELRVKTKHFDDLHSMYMFTLKNRVVFLSYTFTNGYGYKLTYREV